MANIFTETQNISLTRGDDWAYEIPVVDSNNQPYDFTGYTSPASEMRLKADDTVLATFTVTLSTGIIKLELPKATTAALTPQVNKYDVQVVFPDTLLRTIVKGDFTVVADITKL